jgi:hypothetical protein
MAETAGTDWTRAEVEAIVEDHLDMLAHELAGARYNKTAHRDALAMRLPGRSDGAIEFKHANISAVLLAHRFPFIPGYKPRGNYQGLLEDVVLARVLDDPRLLALAAADVERPMIAPEVPDILRVLTPPPQPRSRPQAMRSPTISSPRLHIDYLAREAGNRSLGAAGEQFVLAYERARLISAGCDSLAARIEHTSQVRGDHEGYDILSFEPDGRERLVEVKTTKYGAETPFFVSRNEVDVSAREAACYHVYRMFAFRENPRLFVLPGSIGNTCEITAATFLARPR